MNEAAGRRPWEAPPVNSIVDKYDKSDDDYEDEFDDLP